MRAHLSVKTLPPMLVAALALLAAGCDDKRVDAAAPPQRASAVATSEPREETLGPLRVPDVVLTNQRGEKVRLYSDLIAGHAVAMSFVFTRCTTICPLLGASFSRLQRQLGDRAGKAVKLVSITLDPANDTPAQLAAWGKRFDAGPAWTLLTGSQQDIDEVLKAMTVFTVAKEDHAPIVLLGNDSTGMWVRAYGLSSPTVLISTLDRLLGATPNALRKEGE